MLQPELVLQKRLHVVAARYRWAWPLLLFVTTALLLAAFALLVSSTIAHDQAAGAFTQALASAWQKNPLKLAAPSLLLLAAIALAAFEKYRAKHDRLYLSDEGIRYRSRFPWLVSSWALRWDELRAVKLHTRLTGRIRAQTAVLSLETAQHRYRVRPFDWLAADEPLSPRTLFLRGKNRGDPLDELPLMRYLHERGVVPTSAAGTNVANFALEHNPRAAAAALAIVAVLIYAFADMVANSEAYLVRPPYWAFAGGGVLAAALVLPWLRRGQVPRAVAAGLAAMLALVVGIALFPFLLRVNQLTDTHGLQPHAYTFTPPGGFAAVDAHMPDIELTRFETYWEKLRPGTLRLFSIRRGGLGFYQIDLAPLYDEIRQHNNRRRSPHSDGERGRDTRDPVRPQQII